MNKYRPIFAFACTSSMMSFTLLPCNFPPVNPYHIIKSLKCGRHRVTRQIRTALHICLKAPCQKRRYRVDMLGNVTMAMYLSLTNMCLKEIYEPVHEISNNLVCATSKASDQPAHTRSLIRAFASRLSIL